MGHSSLGFLNQQSKGQLKENNLGKVGRPFALSATEQEELVKCLVVAGDWGFPLTFYDIRLIVKSFLDRQVRNEERFHNNLPG